MDERPFHNVFSSFRGPSARREQEGSDAQLEDNATKALVNVLELAPAGAELTVSFLGQVTHVDVPATPAQPAFFLQGGPDTVQAPERYLLGLSVSGEPAPEADDAAVDGQGRADAAIYLPGQLLCALEVNVRDGELEYPQLARHAQRWGVASAEQWRTASWPDVYRWASAELDGRDPVSRFLLEQLLAFLRIADLTPFIGFFPSDFAFFEQPAEERTWRQRQRIRIRMAQVWEAVVRELDDDLLARLGEPTIQSIKPYERAAVVSTPKNDRGVNMTIELWPDEVQLNVVGWNDWQGATFAKWLRSNNGEAWLHAHPEFELVVFRRFPTAFTPDGRPIWRSQSEEELPGHIPAGDFTSERLDQALAQLPEGDHPGFHLRTAWTRERALAVAADIAGEIATELRVLEPLLEQINANPARRVVW